jgi:hypothetical protein
MQLFSVLREKSVCLRRCTNQPKILKETLFSLLRPDENPAFFVFIGEMSKTVGIRIHYGRRQSSPFHYKKASAELLKHHVR